MGGRRCLLDKSKRYSMHIGFERGIGGFWSALHLGYEEKFCGVLFMGLVACACTVGREGDAGWLYI